MTKEERLKEIHHSYNYMVSAMNLAFQGMENAEGHIACMKIVLTKHFLREKYRMMSDLSPDELDKLIEEHLHESFDSLPSDSKQYVVKFIASMAVAEQVMNNII